MVVLMGRAGDIHRDAASIAPTATSHRQFSLKRRSMSTTAAAGTASNATLEPVATIAARCSTTAAQPARVEVRTAASGNMPTHHAATKFGLPSVTYTRMRGFANVSGTQPSARRGSTPANCTTAMMHRIVEPAISALHIDSRETRSRSMANASGRGSKSNSSASTDTYVASSADNATAASHASHSQSEAPALNLIAFGAASQRNSTAIPATASKHSLGVANGCSNPGQHANGISAITPHKIRCITVVPLGQTNVGW